MIHLASEATNPNVLRLPLDELIIGTVAFFIVFFVLAKFAFPNIKKTLAERVDKIEGGMARADQAQAQANALLEQYRQQLAQARNEAAEIRAQAQADRQTIVEQARVEATAAAEQVTARAQAQLAADQQQMRTDLIREVGSLSVNLAGKIVGESLTDDARVSATVDRFITDLEQLSTSTVEPV